MIPSSIISLNAIITSWLWYLSLQYGSILQTQTQTVSPTALPSMPTWLFSSHLKHMLLFILIMPSQIHSFLTLNHLRSCQLHLPDTQVKKKKKNLSRTLPFSDTPYTVSIFKIHPVFYHFSYSLWDSLGPLRIRYQDRIKHANVLGKKSLSQNENGGWRDRMKCRSDSK